MFVWGARVNRQVAFCMQINCVNNRLGCGKCFVCTCLLLKYPKYFKYAPDSIHTNYVCM